MIIPAPWYAINASGAGGWFVHARQTSMAHVAFCICKNSSSKNLAGMEV